MNRWKDWRDQAHRDMERAWLDVEHGFYEWACFTAQQAAEKMVKALGMKLGIELWGHSLTQMLKAIAEEKGIDIPSSVSEAARELDKYYIPTRYPNGFASGKPADYFSREDAERALGSAREIFRFCEGYLSRQGESS